VKSQDSTTGLECGSAHHPHRRDGRGHSFQPPAGSLTQMVPMHAKYLSARRCGVEQAGGSACWHVTDEALRVLLALVTGQAAILGGGLEVTLAPGSAMPPVLVAGKGDKALRRAAAYGDGWLCIGRLPEEVTRVSPSSAGATL